MAKKQKKTISERVPTKRQLSKWQRQMRIRRIVIIAAVVFLVGISSWVGYEYYKDYKSNPLHQVVIKVNDASFTMEYYVKLLVGYTTGMNSTDLSYMGDTMATDVANEMIKNEVLRQGAKNLGIEVTSEEIAAKLKEVGLPDDEAYRYMAKSVLLQDKLDGYYGSQQPNTTEQAHVQAMLVESQEVATELIAEIKAGGNFTALAKEFSCNSSVEGDLGWLPKELMPNTIIADAAFNLTTGEISQPIYNATATKNVGYWLIEVTDKQDQKINALVMLLGSEAKAEQVKAQLAAGGNFSALAGNYSQHESKTAGGKLDGLKPGDMGSNAFDAVAFNITLNEVSEPVKDTSVNTTGGYWLVKVIDRGDHELDETVKKELIDKHFNDSLEAWKGNSTIENLLDASKRSWALEQVLKGR
ncbi:MAG: peptidylprolyl isomerase [Dehalococcoidia bacterium]